MATCNLAGGCYQWSSRYITVPWSSSFRRRLCRGYTKGHQRTSSSLQSSSDIYKRLPCFSSVLWTYFPSSSLHAQFTAVYSIRTLCWRSPKTVTKLPENLQRPEERLTNNLLIEWVTPAVWVTARFQLWPDVILCEVRLEAEQFVHRANNRWQHSEG